MITVNAFFSETLNTVDAVIGSFVNTAYENFIQENSGMITLLFTVYVVFIGYKFLIHDHQANMSFIVRRVVLMSCVYGMVMSWDLYNLFIYQIFTNEPGNIAKILVNSVGGMQSGANIAQVLDAIYESVINTSMLFFSQVNFSSAGIAFLFYGILVFVIGTVMCVVALLLFIYAKMMMAIALALGPIFILFIMWDSTRDMFASWLRKLVTLALIPVVTSAILVLMLSVINTTLVSINQPIENLQFSGIAPFLGLSLATALILSQVFRICGSLGGGISLASISAAAGIAKSSLNYSGVSALTNKTAAWSKNQFSQIKKNLFRSAS